MYQKVHDYTPSVFNAYDNGEITLIQAIKDVLANSKIGNGLKLEIIEEIASWEEE